MSVCPHFEKAIFDLWVSLALEPTCTISVYRDLMAFSYNRQP